MYIDEDSIQTIQEAIIAPVIESLVNVYQTKIDALNSKIEYKDKTISQFESKVASLKQTEVVAKYNDALSTIEMKDRQLATMTDLINDLEKVISGYEEDRSTLRGNYTVMSKGIESLKQEVLGIRTENKKLEELIAEKEDALVEYRKLIIEQETEIEDLKLQNYELRVEVNVLQESLKF